MEKKSEMGGRLKGELLYQGKAKKLFAVVGQPDEVWVEYMDTLTAFNAQKRSSFAQKGSINAQITSLIYQELARNGIRTHWLQNLSQNEIICKKVTIIPLEVVTRNRLAGSTAKKFAIEEGAALDQPLVEFYYKNDALSDPFVSDDQALWLKAVARREDLDSLRREANRINRVLKSLFLQAGFELIDFKLEFGWTAHHELLLADEISPDTCRLWDVKTGEKFDKDRFRRDLGRVEESYHEVLDRLTKALQR